MLEREVDEIMDRVARSGRDHVVVGLGLLQHQPHRLHVVARVPPVPRRVEIAERHLPVEPELDARGGVGHLPRHEVERTPRRLVVVEDPGGRVEAVANAVAPRDEVAVRLRNAVRRER